MQYMWQPPCIQCDFSHKIYCDATLPQPCPDGSTDYRDVQCQAYNAAYRVYYRGGASKFIKKIKEKHLFIKRKWETLPINVRLKSPIFTEPAVFTRQIDKK